jgi:uncharacterized protein YhaN
VRILQLGLAPCGPFQQQQFDFGSEKAGLHVVYGPNEAGKSSTLRAVSALLYGFKDDELRFGAEDPRVHGVLADPAGEQLAFSRRRGRKDTLLDAARQPLPADSLERFLRSVSHKMFREFFGIDWRALQDGSLHLLQDRGDLAESLFGASLGGAELRRLLKDLEDRAKEKFTPNTRTKGIPKLLSDCKQLEGELKSNITKPEQFARLQQELAKASRDGDKLRVAEQQSRGRLALLGRQRDSLTLWQELCQLRAQREALGHVPSLSKDFAERRVGAQTARAKAQAELRELKAQRQAVCAELERLELRPAWLEHAPAITRLHERRPAIEALRRELPLRSAEAGRLDAERKQLRQQLGLPAEASCASPLQRDRLHHLAEQLNRDRQTHAALLQAVEERRGRLHDTRCKLDSLVPSPDPQPLQLLLEHSGRCVEREEQWQRAQARAQRLARELDESLQRLPLWSGSLEELVGYRRPLPAQIEGLQEQLRLRAAGTEEVKRDAQRLRQRQSDLQREYERADVDLPALCELPDLRARRRQLWEEHCAAPADAELSAELQRCMEACDDIADRLLAGAERHARRQALALELEQIRGGLAELDAREDRLQQEGQELQQQWSALWSPLPAREPQIMAQWLAACERLLQQHAAWSQAEEDSQELSRWVQSAREGLIRSFLELGNAAPAENTTLAELHLRIRAQVQAMEGPRARRRQLEGELSTLESDLARDESRCGQLGRSLQQGEGELGRVLAELRLDPAIQPAEVPALLQMLTRLETAERDWHKLQLAVEAETEQLQTFEADVRQLVEQLMPAHPDRSAEIAVRALWSELENEQRRGRERLERERQLQQIGVAEARQEQLRVQAEQEILRLLNEAESVLEEHLPTLEDYAQRAAALDLLITEKRLGLQRLHPGREAAGIELELETLEASWLETQQAQEGEKLAGISERLREVDQRSGALQNELQQLTERHGSMDKAQELENLHNRILDESQQFLRLQLALGVLRKEVERYSQSRQEPLLQGTSRYFERLTRGRYQSVLADYLPGLDRQVLFGVRGGDQVSVEHMSQGARDQLCLALRLATLDHWMERRGPFPLVLDDLCVQFDDQRAGATLEVLAEVGQRTQVLFFTHLQRDLQLSVPLAERGMACIHQLPAPEGSI